jgi:hypothetical protein
VSDITAPSFIACLWAIPFSTARPGRKDHSRLQTTTPVRRLALFMMYYNFCKLHKAHRLTPAMAAGVTDRLWEVADIVKVLEEWERST